MGAKRGWLVVDDEAEHVNVGTGREPSSSGLHSTRLRAAGGIELQLNSSRALKSRQMEFSNPAISRSNKTSANPKPQVFTRQAGTAGVPQMVLGAVIPVLQLVEPGQGAGRELSPASRAGEDLLSALRLPGEAQQLSTLLGPEILISCPKSVPRTRCLLLVFCLSWSGALVGEEDKEEEEDEEDKDEEAEDCLTS
ncbi:hypothetical protein Anapl_08718 [Anas platyrhynchos]|uniref:Uncharacterized protein n=1 Tax=Anas platyrhynchos TaxID=8839 RepID=R0KY77_ANAPL|nr:hypothetical protein Anapl_08718 [Anas platyrhynchos]